MDEPRSLKIVTVGLILAALAVGYFLLTGGFSVSKPKKVQKQDTQIAGVTSPSPTASPAATSQPQPTSAPSSAYSRIVERAQSNVQALPATGFPAGLAIVFSAGAIISGWSLRKYPH